MEQITSQEPTPPRQVDEQIPRELDRICLKALAKRASERYSTARDMADDLRYFLAEPAGGPVARRLPGTARGRRPRPCTGAVRHRDAFRHEPVRVVPKGLRSFDEHDAEFFLELLPGPRDRYGLPESLRFWKTLGRGDRSRQDGPGRADLRPLRMRQVVAGQGRPAAAPLRADHRRLHRGHAPRDRDPVAERAEEALSRRCPTTWT